MRAYFSVSVAVLLAVFGSAGCKGDCEDKLSCGPQGAVPEGGHGQGGDAGQAGAGGAAGGMGGTGGVGGEEPPYVVALDGGFHHTCAWLSPGDVWCWGLDTEGQLGDGMMMNSNVPVRVADLMGTGEQIGSGDYHTCAVVGDGTAACWGRNTDGELGNGDSGSGVFSATPVAVEGLTDVVQVSGGSFSSCAATSRSLASCWGGNAEGQLGNGDSGPGVLSATPVAVEGLTDVATVSVGSFHACALRKNATVSCWGLGISGQLGNMSNASSPTPVDVVNLTSVAEMYAGSFFTCARKTNGTVWCWGLDSSGQLGNGGADANSNVPVQVSGIGTAVSLALGLQHACVALADGGVRCWGQNGQSQLGNDMAASHEGAPVAVDNLTNIASVAAGAVHSCALALDQRAWCWGQGTDGQLGNATNDTSVTPVEVSSLWVPD